MRIVFLPLDERFCTKDYFIMLAESFNLNVLFPENFGYKKIPADVDYISDWLVKNVKKNDYLIISLDMLLHGGLIPSRIDFYTIETLMERLKVLRRLKERDVKIYAVKTLSRIPKYNSDDEEPDYWEFHGEKLYQFSLKLAKGEKKIPNDIPKWIIDDFLRRRKRNFKITKEILNYVKNGIIEYLGVLLDDNSEGSLLYKESKELEELVNYMGINKKVSIRNGADEALLAMLAKSMTDYFNIKPSFKIIYSFPESKFLIPPYESFPLYINVENHIESCGGIISGNKANVILYVNNFKGDEETREAAFQKRLENNISEKIFNKNKIVGIADVRYANGSDKALVENLLSMDINWNKVSYYGWNTPGNTIGSTCAHATLQYLANEGYLKVNSYKMKKYQAILILEHYGYQADVRQKLERELIKRLDSKYLKPPYTIMPFEDWVKDFTKKNLKEYLYKINLSFSENWDMEIFFPWHRTFEIGLKFHKIM